jgi:uncharacterized protein YacL
MQLNAVTIILLLLAASLLLTARLIKWPSKRLLTTLVGLVTGLVVGALLAIPLSSLPGVLGQVTPITAAALSGLVFSVLFAARGAHLVGFLYQALTGRGSLSPEGREIVVDTSAIIDGRIGEIAKSGFLFGTLLVPRIVLEELQNIADSTDPIRRGKGRRGLEVLTSLEKNKDVIVEVIEVAGRVKTVDAKLVQIAKQRGACIMTTDYNLNRVAEIERVAVLNVNELANALRPNVLPGEELSVKVISKGKERGQGVGYLPDGTMIVVENGDKLVGQEIQAEVSRALQTVAGKMIFVTAKTDSRRKS